MEAHIAHGFKLFSNEELGVGIAYAAAKDKVTLDYGRLRTLANDAGKTRLNGGGKLTPRDAASRAVKAFLRTYRGVHFTERSYQGYVHAIAKMMSERNPRTLSKRQREADVEEILAITHNIDQTPEIDPEINRQLSLKLTGNIYEKTADVL